MRSIQKKPSSGRIDRTRATKMPDFSWDTLQMQLHGFVHPPASPFTLENDSERLRKETEALGHVPNDQKHVLVMIWRTGRFRYPQGYPSRFNLSNVAEAILKSAGKHNHPVFVDHTLWKGLNTSQTEQILASWRSEDHANWRDTCALDQDGKPTSLIPLRATTDECLALMILHDNNPKFKNDNALQDRWSSPLAPPPLLQKGLERLDLMWMLTGSDPPPYWEGANFYCDKWREKWMVQPVRTTTKLKGGWEKVDLNALFREDYLAEQYLGIPRQSSARPPSPRPSEPGNEIEVANLRNQVVAFRDQVAQVEFDALRKKWLENDLWAIEQERKKERSEAVQPTDLDVRLGAGMEAELTRLQTEHENLLRENEDLLRKNEIERKDRMIEYIQKADSRVRPLSEPLVESNEASAGANLRIADKTNLALVSASSALADATSALANVMSDLAKYTGIGLHYTLDKTLERDFHKSLDDLETAAAELEEVLRE